MFPDVKQNKNRRFHPWEIDTERDLAKIFRRPMRTFFHDDPFYPYLPPTPLANQYANFKLNFVDSDE